MDRNLTKLIIASLFILLALNYEAHGFIGADGREVKFDNASTQDEAFFTFLNDLQFSSNGYVLLPSGTVAERPSSPVAGMIRYNEDDATFEGYTSDWGPIAGGGGLSKWAASTDYDAGAVVYVDEDDLYLIYEAKTTFTSGASFDDSNWNELSKSKADAGEFLVDPGFEYGVVELSCTNATVAQQASAGLNNSAAARITFTADGGYCDLVKTFTGDDENQKLLVGSYVKTSDANVTFHPIKAASETDEVEVGMTGEYYAVNAQIFSSGSTGFRIKGNNTETVDLDLATNRLGGYEVGVSKNCTTELDCENTLTGFYDSSEATLADAVKKQTPNEWVTSTAKGGTNDFQKTFTVPNGTFSELPNCTTGTSSNNSNVDYRESLSTVTSLVFETRSNADNTANDNSFTFSCTKAPADFNSLNQKGVVITGSSAGAELVVTNEGTTSNVTIGNATITVPFDTVKSSKYIEWDTSTEEATFQKSGKYEVTLESGVFDSDTPGQVLFFPQLNTGSGFTAPSNDDSKCTTSTSSADDKSYTSCSFIINGNTGNVLRMRATGNSANLVIDNSGVRYPRMIVTPVLDQETIAGEFRGIPKYVGEDTMIQGYASFGGGTDGSVCSSSPCTRYRVVGALAGNMSVTRSGTGTYSFSISGFKASSNFFCNAVARIGTGAVREIWLDPADLQADGAGSSTINLNSYNFSGSDADTYFTIKCEGLAP